MERGTGGEVNSWCYTSAMPPTPRHLVCTAARPNTAAPFAPAWKSETAVLLARGIVMDAAPDRLPILADALEEAGCDDPIVLGHCRECVRHFPHCWVLAEVLDRPTVVEAPRMTDAEVRREVERVTGRPVEASDADSDWRPRRWVWRFMPLLVGAVVLAAVRVGFTTPRPTPYTNTFPTYLAPAVAPAR
jgi:hypothetical protein